MTKNQIRKKHCALRATLTEADVQSMSAAIAENLYQMDIWDKTFFHVFMPIAYFNEVDTSFIIKILQSKNKKIVLSKSNFENHEMTHFLMEKDTVFINNKYNIPEPENAKPIEAEKIDVVFVPLLAFDKTGNRVGYGKGFYDRFLSKCHSNCVFVGLSYFEAEQSIEGISFHDFKLHYCVLPNQIIHF